FCSKCLKRLLPVEVESTINYQDVSDIQDKGWADRFRNRYADGDFANEYIPNDIMNFIEKEINKAYTKGQEEERTRIKEVIEEMLKEKNSFEVWETLEYILNKIDEKL